MKRLLKKIERFISRIKQRRLIGRLLKDYGFNQIVNIYAEKSEKGEPIKKDSPIWVCWWQGEDNMPEVVRACYSSIKQHACNHPVVMITIENKDKYLHLPDFIWKKYDDGKISPTHLSDVARMFLLKEYGGIWIDITNFVTQDVDSFVDVETLGYWSCKHITSYNNVSRGLWTSYFLASGKDALIPSYIYDSLVKWWKENDSIVDYLLMDYVFYIGYCNVPSIKTLVDALPLNVIGTFRKAIGKKYDDLEWEYYYRQAGFQKLSYKKYTEKQTKKGEKTHYAVLIERYMC